jgi:hypothetical protein
MANGGIIGPINDPIINNTSTTQAFTASGTFTARSSQPSVDLLVVAGGAAGGYGGGGAGGFRLLTSQPVPSSGVPVVIGAGGTKSPPAPAPSRFGVASSFGSISASGGGAGTYSGTTTGGAGGSGSGVCSSPGVLNPGGAGNAGSYSPPEGNPGGSSNVYNGSGGGGAGGAGTNAGAWPGPGVPGGAGSSVTSIFGAAPQPFYGPTSGVYAGGGAGAGSAGGGNGGPGGGGSASATGTATSGTANTGGGGGMDYGDVSLAGNGGSGIVLVQQPAFAIAPGVWSLSEQYNFKKAGQWS